MTKLRKIRFHRRLSLLLAIVLTLAIIIAVLKRSALLPYQFSKFVNEHYFKDTPFKFSCSRISGDFVNLVKFEKLSLSYSDGRVAYTVFWVREATVNYRLSKLVGMKLFIDDLTLKDVRVRIERDKEGRLVVPMPNAPPTAGGESMAPHIEVDRFGIDGLQVLFSGGKRNLRIRDVFLAGSLRYMDNAGILEIENGTGRLIDSGTSIHSLRAHVEFQGRDVQLRDFVARLDQSYIMASGGYNDGRLDRLQLAFNPMDLKELSDIGVLPPNQGQLGGNVTCNGPLDSLSVSGSLTGTGWRMVFSGFSFTGVLTPDRLTLSQATGDLFGSQIDGELVYDLGGKGGFAFDGYCADLDLSQGFIPGEGTPETDLFGKIRVEYQKATETYQFEGELDSAVVGGFEVQPLKIRGNYRNGGGARFEMIEMSRPGLLLTGSGRVDDKNRADLLFEIRGDSLEYLWRQLSLPRIDGRIAVSGHLSGPLDDFRINLNGDFQNLAYLFTTFDRGTVQAQVNHAPGDSASVVLDLRGENVALEGRWFSCPHVLLAAAGKRTVIRDFSFSRGDTSVTMDFNLLADTSGTQAVFKHLSIAAGNEVWNIARPVELYLTEQTARLDSFVLTSGSGTIGLDGEYSTAARRCRLSSWGETVDLALLKDALDLPVRIEGRGDFKLEVSGEIDNPQVEMNVELGKGRIDSLVFNRLELRGSFSNRTEYRLDRLRLLADGDTLSAAGSWDFPDSPVRIIKSGFDRDKAFGYPLKLEAEFTRYPLADLFRNLHLAIRPSGEFTGTLSVGRTAQRPHLNLAGTISGAERSGLYLPDIRCEATYEDSLLVIHRVEFDDGQTRGRAEGTLPIVLDIISGLTFREEAPLKLSCELRSNNLRSLHPYIDQTGELSGELVALISLNGTFGQPLMGGRIVVKRGAVRLSGMETLYQDINLVAQLNGNRIEISTLNGRDEKKGRFGGSGSIALSGFKPDQYNIELDLHDLNFSPSLEFSSILNGTVTIQSSRLPPNGLPVPAVSGSVDIKEAQIQLVLETEGGVGGGITAPTTTPGWIADIDLHAPKNVWVRNPDLRMELGGDVIFKKDERGEYLRGQCQVLRGTYNLYNNKFRITDGTFDFSKGYAYRPEMFLNAYTPYRREGDREHRIYLTVSWPIDKKEPEVTLSYDEPGYSETDIWKMLGGGYVAGADQSGQGSWDAAGTAKGLASNYLERILSEQMTDLNIEVETQAPSSRSQTSSRDLEMSIAVGKYLSEDLYLKYRQGLSIGSDREVDIEYRLSNMLLIRSEIIRYSDKLYFGQRRQTSDEINLDIKFRFEY